MLFAAPLIEGLAYEEGLVDPGEEKELLKAIQGLDLTPFRFQGWTGKRLTRSFGWSYDFDDRKFLPAEPIPAFLDALLDRAASFSRIPRVDFVHALVTRYDPGAGIGWHRDRPQFGKIVGISLGGPATLRFRKRMEGRFRRAQLELAPRSAYLLSGEVRENWEHGIAAHRELRFSITFRTLSARGSTAASAPPG